MATFPDGGAATLPVPHVLNATGIAPNAYVAMQLADREQRMADLTKVL